MTTRWVLHPLGCLCPECSELRAAVGSMRGRDKHIARLQETKAVASRALLAQRRREADARAEVNRELADCGSYPYRDSGGGGVFPCPGCGFRFGSQPTAATRCQYCGEKIPAKRQPVRYDKPVTAPEPDISDCTCKPPAWNPGSPYWAAHRIECPMRVRLCTQGPITAGRKTQSGKLALTPEQEILAGIYEPLGLDYGQLIAAFPDQPPDACGNCRTGPLFACYRCWYCHALDEMAAARQALPGTHRDRPVSIAPLLAVLLALAVFWTVMGMIAAGALG